MKTPDIIYVQTQGEWRLHNWSKERIYDTDRIYFSEDAVKEAVIDMLCFANIDNFDEAIKYIMNKLKDKNKKGTMMKIVNKFDRSTIITSKNIKETAAGYVFDFETPSGQNGYFFDKNYWEEEK